MATSDGPARARTELSHSCLPAVNRVTHEGDCVHDEPRRHLQQSRVHGLRHPALACHVPACWLSERERRGGGYGTNACAAHIVSQRKHHMCSRSWTQKVTRVRCAVSAPHPPTPAQGDPSAAPYAVENAKQIVGQKPIFGICMGHQILGQAFGGTTFKLKFGHHGGNHPIRAPGGVRAAGVGVGAALPQGRRQLSASSFIWMFRGGGVRVRGGRGQCGASEGCCTVLCKPWGGGERGVAFLWITHEQR